MAVVFEGGLGLVAVGLGWLIGSPPMTLVRWTPAGAVWGLAAVLPLVAVLFLCVRVQVWPFTDITRVVDTLLVPMFRGVGLLELAGISLVAGLGEEILFRGVIQEGLSGWIGGPPGVWTGLAAASILFGLLHPVTPCYAAFAALIGLYLGGLWITTGNLLVPIVAHAVYDFLALVYVVKVRGQGIRDRE
jgi:hypothetical protein